MKNIFRIATISAALLTLSLSTSSLWAQDAVAAASAKETGAVVTPSGLVSVSYTHLTLPTIYSV